MNGRIKSFVTDRGFGFIAADDGSDYFFHISRFNGEEAELAPGLVVTFETGQDRNGRPCAVNVEAR